MFDLEKSIAAWRQQMQAAGIRSLSKLDELESHLREHFHLRVKAGLNQERALEQAIATIGHAQPLRAEFDLATQAGSLKMTVRIFALLWLAGGLFSFGTVFSHAFFTGGGFKIAPLLCYSLLAQLIYLAGMVGGVLLLRGMRAGIYILRTVALFFAVACTLQVFNPALGFGWRMWCVAIAGFSVATIYLLNKFLAANPKSQEPDKAYV
jgi:hypothetical protein